MSRRTMVWILSIAMVISMIPYSVFATEGNGDYPSVAKKGTVVLGDRSGEAQRIYSFRFDGKTVNYVDVNKILLARPSRGNLANADDITLYAVEKGQKNHIDDINASAGGQCCLILGENNLKKGKTYQVFLRNNTASDKDRTFLKYRVRYKISKFDGYASDFKITEDEMTVEQGGMAKIPIKATYPTGSFPFPEEWTSSDDAIAGTGTAGLGGYVTGSQQGKVKITARMSNGETDVIRVTVVKPATYKTRITDVEAINNGFILHWARRDCKGYQIRYSPYKNMENASSITVAFQRQRAKVISKLEGGHKYYVQIRTYKTTADKTYYSKWSNKIKVKAK